jgi:hypothetical protein
MAKAFSTLVADVGQKGARLVSTPSKYAGNGSSAAASCAWSSAVWYISKKEGMTDRKEKEKRKSQEKVCFDPNVKNKFQLPLLLILTRSLKHKGCAFEQSTTMHHLLLSLF